MPRPLNRPPNTSSLKRLADLSKSEAAFAREKARSILVEWADQTVRRGGFHPDTEQDLYFEVAQERKWVGKRGPPYKVTSSGFVAAAGFLKR